jgi:tetratricopeptide (TPR) repeat protein
MSGRKLTILLGVIVVVAVTVSLVLVQRRRAQAAELEASIEDSLMRGEGRKAMLAVEGAPPGVLDPEWAALRRGDAMILQRNFKTAKEIAEELLAGNGGDIPALLLHARALAGPGYKDEALADLNRALQLDPKNVDLLAERALVWVAKEDQDKALVDLNAAIALNPKHAESLKQRCVILYSRKQLLESKKDCEAALAAMPTGHRDRTFTEYAVHEALEDLEKEEDEQNAKFAPPATGGDKSAEE